MRRRSDDPLAGSRRGPLGFAFLSHSGSVSTVAFVCKLRLRGYCNFKSGDVGPRVPETFQVDIAGSSGRGVPNAKESRHVPNTRRVSNRRVERGVQGLSSSRIEPYRLRIAVMPCRLRSAGAVPCPESALRISEGRGPLFCPSFVPGGDSSALCTVKQDRLSAPTCDLVRHSQSQSRQHRFLDSC